MTFELTIEQVNLILHALSKLPYEMSADMIGEVRRQAEPQVVKANASPKLEAIADATE